MKICVQNDFSLSIYQETSKNPEIALMFGLLNLKMKLKSQLGIQVNSYCGSVIP